MGRDQLEPQPADPEPVLLDHVEEVDEALARVRRRPGEHRVPGPLRERVDLRGLVPAVVVDRDRRARPDEGAEPGERLDREVRLGLLVEVAEGGERHVPAAGCRPGGPRVGVPRLVRRARAFDPEAPEVDPPVGRALDVEIDLDVGAADRDGPGRLADERDPALEEPGPAGGGTQARLGVAATGDALQVARQERVEVDRGQRRDGARAEAAEGLHLGPVQRPAVDPHAHVVVVQARPAGRPPRAGGALPHHDRLEQGFPASRRLGHREAAGERGVVPLEGALQPVATRDLGVVRPQQGLGKVDPGERGVVVVVGAHQPAPGGGRAVAGGDQHAVVVRELSEVTLLGPQPQRRARAVPEVDGGGVLERGPRQERPVGVGVVRTVGRPPRSAGREHLVPDGQDGVVGRVPVARVGPAHEQVGRAAPVPGQVERQDRADDDVHAVGQRPSGGGGLHLGPVRGEQPEVGDPARATVDQTFQDHRAVPTGRLGAEGERVVGCRRSGGGGWGARVEAVLGLDRAAPGRPGVEHDGADAGRAPRAGLGRGRGHGLDGGRSRAGGHRTARCRATIPPDRLRQATSRQPAAVSRPASPVWSGQARMDSAR